MTTMAEPQTGDRIGAGAAEYNEVIDFFADEAEALDNQKFDDWLALLDPEIDYRMPVRVERMPKDGQGFTPMEFFSENLSSLTTRIKRFDTEQAWSEQPISRVRHLITTPRVYRTDDEAILAVTSNFMTARTHWDFDYDLITGERRDLLRRTDEGPRLRRRLIHIDQTILKSYNLSIFF